MAKKLQNIRAINQMLSGTHKSQTKTTVGYTSKEEERKVGEKWVDEKGVEWEQKEGYKISSSKILDAVRNVLKTYMMPKVCPKCSKEIKDNKYNRKMWNIHKMCFDCVIEMEHEHKINGTFDEYARGLMRPNIESWLKDAKAEMEGIKALLTKAEFVNGDGTVEKWESPWLGKEDELNNILETNFENLKKYLLGEVENEPSGNN
jgi:hypothetical protein